MKRAKTNKKSDQSGKKSPLGCVVSAVMFENKLHPGLGKEPLCCSGSLWVFPHLPLPHETFLVIQGP